MTETREVVAAGKDVAEAKENARALLGVDELADVKFEVLHLGSRGIFGIIGVKPAQVRAYIEVEGGARPERRQRRERPQPERKVENKEKAPRESAEINSEDAQREPQGGEGRSQKNRRRRGGKGHRQEIPTTFTEQLKPKGEVIPEVELKMELKVVEPGEDMPFDFIGGLIRDIGLNAYAELYTCEDGTRRIAIAGQDASVLIGHHGDTLDALQYLANLASARKNSKGERDKSRVTIDIEGYRAKREDTLRALARRMAAKALKNRRSVMLEPMTAYERRIIHSEVQKIEGVATNSIGSDNNRKIVIYLVDKKPEELFEAEEEKVEEIIPETIAAEATQEADLTSADATPVSEDETV